MSSLFNDVISTLLASTDVIVSTIFTIYFASFNINSTNKIFYLNYEGYKLLSDIHIFILA